MRSNAMAGGVVVDERRTREVLLLVVEYVEDVERECFVGDERGRGGGDGV